MLEVDSLSEGRQLLSRPAREIDVLLIDQVGKSIPDYLPSFSGILSRRFGRIVQNEIRRPDLLVELVGSHVFWHHLIPFAFLCAARTAFRNPSFFQVPFFFLNLGATCLNARPYFLFEADARRFFFAGSYARRAVFRVSPLVVPCEVRDSPQFGQ